MTLTPKIVEERISEAGRVRVFNRAFELGWAGKEPPLWVWNQIALEIIATRRSEQAVTPDDTEIMKILVAMYGGFSITIVRDGQRLVGWNPGPRAAFAISDLRDIFSSSRDDDVMEAGQ